MNIKRILCPTDFSDFSAHALEHAATLAGYYTSTITVLHVFDAIEPSVDLALLERLREATVRAAEPAADKSVEVDVRVEVGSPVRQILECASSLPADLIVIGTHGAGGFEHLVLGSVTEKVLRQAPCPVLTVPPPAEGVHPEGSVLFRRIVCPVDFSPASLAALAHALKLAEESCAEIDVLHVIEWLAEEDPTAHIAGFDVPEFRRQLQLDAEARLRTLIPGEVRDWCKPREQVTGGRPWREILRVAEERKAELVVMGVRGRNPIDLALFGSTTHHVVRGARCPVLVVHTD